MALPQHRNPRKYKRKKFNPMVGMPAFRLIDRQAEPERPFNLDDPQPTFEDWLNEIPTIENMLLEGEDDRLLMDDGDNYDEDSYYL